MSESLAQKVARIRKSEGLMSVGIRAVKSLVRRITAPFAMFYYADIKGELDAEMKTNATPESTLDFTFNKLGGIIQPFQHKDEMIRLAKLAAEKKPKTVVEIGTARGGTLFMLARLASPDALIVSIDLPGGEYGGGYPAWKAPYYRRFASKTQRIELMRDNSHDAKTVEKLEKILGGKKIDLLFIDGDHTYEGVKRDYEIYSPLVRDGGVISFHDVSEHLPELDCHVEPFWKEVRQGKKFEEFITASKDPKDRWGGIGVLFKGTH
jgi:predicted O-methyltransferase YrrM